jgi:hypothetical protein
LVVRAGVLAGSALAVAACGDSDPAADEPLDSTAVTAPAPQVIALDERLEDLAESVSVWSGASSAADAHAAAESAANLIVGPFGPGFGDRDGDGTTLGARKSGLLPGLEGRPRGVAMAARAAGASRCVTAEVLGGDWSDPGLRWQKLARAIDGWTSTDDTLADLPSLAQRVVGLATLALGSDDVEVTQRHGAAAVMYVEAMRDADESCS